MALTAFTQKKMGDHVLGKAAWSMPAAAYLALFSASPGENGSLTSEITGGSYARVSLTALMGACDAVTGIATNTSAVTFAAPTANWGSVQYLGVVDASTGGNVLDYTQVDNARVVNNGDPAVSFVTGSIIIKLSGSELGMISSYLMKKLIDHMLAKAAYTMPTAVYHGLLGSNPTVAGTLTSEVGVGGYARQLLTDAMGVFDLSTGIATNEVAVTYPTPTANYPTVNYSFVADAVAAGNLLYANQLPSPLSILNGQAPAQFNAGSVIMGFA